MGSGTDVALETADAALTHNRLTGLAQMISAGAPPCQYSPEYRHRFRVEGVFLVTTLLGLTGLWLAVLADTGATVLVTANALRLLRKSKVEPIFPARAAGSRSLGSPDKAQRAAIRGYSLRAALSRLRLRTVG